MRSTVHLLQRVGRLALLMACTSLAGRAARAQDGVISGRVDIVWDPIHTNYYMGTNVIVWDVWKDWPNTNRINRRSTRTDDEGRFEFPTHTNRVHWTNFQHWIYTDAWNSSTNNAIDRWWTPRSTNEVWFIPRKLGGETDWYNPPSGLEGFGGPYLHTNYAQIRLPKGGVIEGKIENQSGTASGGAEMGVFYTDSGGMRVDGPRVQSDTDGNARMDKLWPGSFYPYTYTSTNVYDQHHPGVEYYGPPSGSDIPEGAEAIETGIGTHTNTTFSLRDAELLPVTVTTTNLTPVEDAEVSMRDAWGNTVSTEEKTDANGEATITKIKPGESYPFASPPYSSGFMYEYWGGRFRSTNEVAADDPWVFRSSDPPPDNAVPLITGPGGGLSTNELDMTVEPYPQLTINVRNGNTGTPVPDIRVTAYSPEGERYAYDNSDSGGEATPRTLPGYTFLDGWRTHSSHTNVLPGYYDNVPPSGDKARMPQGATPVYLQPGEAGEVTLNLYPGVEQSVTVQGGSPNSTLYVYVDGVRYHSGEMDAMGQATAFVPPDSTATIEIIQDPHMGESWMSRSTTTHVGPGGGSVVIDMDQGQTLDGTVMLETDTGPVPAMGGYLSIHTPGDPYGGNSAYAYVNPDGTFTMNGLDGGSEWDFTAYPEHGMIAERYLSVTGSVTIANPPGTTHIDITLPRRSSIRGNLDVSGVQVYGVDETGLEVDWDMTDDDGGFILSGWAGRALRLRTERRGTYPPTWIGTGGVETATSSYPPGSVQSFTMPPPGETVTIPDVTLPQAPGVLVFHVTARRHGRAVRGTEVFVATPEGFPMGTEQVPSGAGTIVVTGLPLNTPLAAGAHKDGYVTVWHPGVPGSDDRTEVPSSAGTLILTGPKSGNVVTLQLEEPGPGPLISDVSPEAVLATPDPAAVGKDSVTTTIVVSNRGPHLASSVEVLVTETPTGGYAFASSDCGQHDPQTGVTTLTIENVGFGAATTGTLVRAPVSTGVFETVITVTPAGFDPEASNNVRRIAAENISVMDDDGDGIPNWYELQHSGSTTGLAPGDDGDGDRIKNRDEWILRSSPTVSNAPFAILNLQPGGGSGTALTIPTEEARLYTIYRSQDIRTDPPRTPLGTFGGSGNPLTIRDPDGGTQSWYRAAVRAP